MADAVPLRALLVEDSEDDAHLLLRELKKGGFKVDSERVENAEEMRRCLVEKQWDIVLSDYNLPKFDAPSALRLLQESGLDIPFIALSGAVGEEKAVEIIVAGAENFLMKGKYELILPAVRRALLNAEERYASKRYQEEIRITKERMQTVVTNLPMILLSVDKDGVITVLEGKGLSALGLRATSQVGKSLATEYTDYPEIITNYERTIRSGYPSRSVLSFNEQFFDAYYTPVTNDTGITVGVNVVMIDSTEQHKAREQLEHQATHDALTELPNRALMEGELDIALKIAARSQQPLALFFMDLNKFKEINDTLGHQAGNQLLQAIGPRLRKRIRASDTIARLGGDEFSVLLPDTDAAGAEQVARDIVSSLEEPFIIDGQTLYIGTSIGIALFPKHGEDGKTLVRRADIAMYAAKRSGGGYAFYSSGQDVDSSLENIRLTTELRSAIANKQMVLHYQPQVETATGLVNEVEALIRWRHPTDGLIPPARFLSLAERHGLMGQITDWVLSTALTQVRTWQDMGHNINVSVNLSMENLLDENTPARVRELLDASGVRPDQLTVEITESSIMRDPSKALETANRLHDMGVKLSVDDFGTVYASLTYLRQFPIQQVKVDQSFVKNMVNDRKDAAIVAAVISLAHGLGVGAVAEGVEDLATWDAIKKMGCQHAQGYFMGAPMPAEDMLLAVSDIYARLGTPTPKPA